MSSKAKSSSTNTTTRSETGSKTAKASTVEGTQIREAGEQEYEQGYRGALVDPTPSENYTVAGVIAGKPTPETDVAHATAVRNAVNAAPEKLAPTHPAQKHLQDVADTEAEQGFRGTAVDITPNSSYGVAGVVSKAPTPETDAKASKAAREATGAGMSGIEIAAAEKEANRKARRGSYFR